MAIKNISALFELSNNNIKKFLTSCSISEKMNTHYVKISIISPNNIICLKGNNEVVTQTDIILNKMWRNYIEDWTLIKNNPGFKEFAKRYIGCTLGLYYFPNHIPLGTEYEFKGERCYIINKIYDNYNKANISLNIAFKELKFYMGISGLVNPDGKYSIAQDNPLYFDVIKLNEILDKISDTNTEEIIKDIKDAIVADFVYATDTKHVNYILKSDKHQYQLLDEDAPDSKNIIDSKERTSYEFVLCDFMKFFHQHNMMSKVRGSYRNIICYLFNEYITKFEAETHTLENNILPESIEPPHVGYDHGDSINDSVYVPNTLTRQLCNSSILYRNVFKLLLANLKVYKHKKYCVYMNDEQIGALNTIVHAIEIIKTDENNNIMPNKKAQKHKYHPQRK